jgi:hypothetical protein
MSKKKKSKADDKAKKSARGGKAKRGKKAGTTGPLSRLGILTKGQTVAGGAALLAGIGLTYWAQRRRSSTRHTPRPAITADRDAAGDAS